MKCPNCQKEIEENAYTCPYCKANLSFTTKTKEEITKTNERIETIEEHGIRIKKGYIIGGILTFIILFIIIIMINLLKFNNIIGLIRFISNFKFIILIAGIILLVITTVLKIKKSKIKILSFLQIISIAFIVIFVFLSTMIKIDGPVPKNYLKSKYITLDKEKIPTMYLILNKKKALFSDEVSNYEGDKNQKFIYIIYENITDVEKYEYQDKLISEKGFKKTILDDGDEVTEILYKNNSQNNCFYTVSVYGSSVTYSKMTGNFEKAVSEMQKNYIE